MYFYFKLIIFIILRKAYKNVFFFLNLESSTSLIYFQHKTKKSDVLCSRNNSVFKNKRDDTKSENNKIASKNKINSLRKNKI